MTVAVVARRMGIYASTMAGGWGQGNSTLMEGLAMAQQFESYTGSKWISQTQPPPLHCSPPTIHHPNSTQYFQAHEESKSTISTWPGGAVVMNAQPEIIYQIFSVFSTFHPNNSIVSVICRQNKNNSWTAGRPAWGAAGNPVKEWNARTGVVGAVDCTADRTEQPGQPYKTIYSHHPGIYYNCLALSTLAQLNPNPVFSLCILQYCTLHTNHNFKLGTLKTFYLPAQDRCNSNWMYWETKEKYEGIHTERKTY